MSEIADVTRTFNELGELKFRIPIPTCDDQKALAILDCAKI